MARLERVFRNIDFNKTLSKTHERVSCVFFALFGFHDRRRAGKWELKPSVAYLVLNF